MFGFKPNYINGFDTRQHLLHKSLKLLKYSKHKTMPEKIKQTIESGKAVLGIEFGSTRIKAVLIDEHNHL